MEYLKYWSTYIVKGVATAIVVVTVIILFPFFVIDSVLQSILAGLENCTDRMHKSVSCYIDHVTFGPPKGFTFDRAVQGWMKYLRETKVIAKHQPELLDDMKENMLNMMSDEEIEDESCLKMKYIRAIEYALE